MVLAWFWPEEGINLNVFHSGLASDILFTEVIIFVSILLRGELPLTNCLSYTNLSKKNKIK